MNMNKTMREMLLFFKEAGKDAEKELKKLFLYFWSCLLFFCRIVSRILDDALTAALLVFIYLYLTQPEVAIEILKKLPEWSQHFMGVVKMIPFWLQVYLQPCIMV